ncbi:MAG: ATP-binding protein [Candidatus Micrarchaeota archaeon]|nr:ATP-binding protein [Candidatus Micrarchaeota archaeon]
MRGRTLSYLLLSLSFSEFLEFSGIESVRFPSSAQELTLSKMACEYLKFGGYPETVLYKRERERLLRELLDVAIQRDIIERYGIRNIKVLRMLIEAIATSSEFSMHRFFNFLKSNGYKVSKNTLYTYLQALEDAFIIHETKRYSKSVRQREQSMSKPYMLDNGLLMVNNVSGGKLFENAVFNALFRNEKLKIYYYSDQSSEVDFIVEEKGAVKALVQASSELNGIETKEREFKALYRASDALDCNKLIIVTLNSKGTEIYKGKKINIMPIWELMLAPVAQW